MDMAMGYTMMLSLILSAILSGTAAQAHWRDPQGSFTPTRVKHAQELLGKYFKKSVVREAQWSDGKTQFVFDWVKKQLDGTKHAKLSKKISRTIIGEASKHEFDPIFVMAVRPSDSLSCPRLSRNPARLAKFSFVTYP